MKIATSQPATSNLSDQVESDLPAELAQPARRALTGAGIFRLEQLTALSEAEVRQLHGIGSKAMDQLHRALDAKGLSFAAEMKR
ncbi:MAG: DNA-binding protein [Chloroflexi bacterium RBG_16_57_11]|nr:MAG: DNA-binding protein [Chloroflexi bacterium RBG_16_57_11]